MVKGPNGAVPSTLGIPYVPPGTTSNVLTSVANNWKSNPLPGGTLPAALTAGNLLTSNGSSWASTPNKVPDAGSSGNILTSDGSNWQSSTPSSALPAVGSSGNVLTSNGAIWSSQPVPTELPTPGTSGNLLSSDGSAWTSVGPLLPAPGLLNNILKSNGSAWTSAAPPPEELPTPDTSGNLLTSNGSAWLSTPNKVPNAGSVNNRLISNGSAWIEAPKTIGTSPYFSSGGTETLTLTAYAQEYYACTGDYVGTILLPNTTTLTYGRQFKFQHIGDMTHLNLKLSDGTSFTTIPQKATVTATCVNPNLNSTSSWKIEYAPFHSTNRNIMISDGTKWVSEPNPLPLPGSVGNTLTSNGGEWLSTADKVPNAAAADNRLISNGSSWIQGSKTSGTNLVVLDSGPTTLTSASTEFWYVNTDGSVHTFILPNVSTMTIGRQFKFSNLKSGVATSKLITIKNHDLDVITTLHDGEAGTFTCNNIIYNEEGWSIEKTFNFPTPTSNGNVLTSDGSNWISQSLPPSVLPSAASTSQVLTANGTNWVSKPQNPGSTDTFSGVLTSIYLTNSSNTTRILKNSTVTGFYVLPDTSTLNIGYEFEFILKDYTNDPTKTYSVLNSGLVGQGPTMLNYNSYTLTCTSTVSQSWSMVETPIYRRKAVVVEMTGVGYDMDDEDNYLIISPDSSADTNIFLPDNTSKKPAGTKYSISNFNSDYVYSIYSSGVRMTKLKVGQVVTATLMTPAIDGYYRYILAKEYLDTAPPIENQIKVSRNGEWGLTESTSTLNKYLQTQADDVPTWNESIPVATEGTWTPTMTLTVGLCTVTYYSSRFWYLKVYPSTNVDISSYYDIKVFVDFYFQLTDTSTITNTPAYIQLPPGAYSRYDQTCTIFVTTPGGTTNKTLFGIILQGEEQIRIVNGSGVEFNTAHIINLDFHGHFSYTANFEAPP